MQNSNYRNTLIIERSINNTQEMISIKSSPVSLQVQRQAVIKIKFM